jgi:hypothetical protein
VAGIIEADFHPAKSHIPKQCEQRSARKPKRPSIGTAAKARPIKSASIATLRSLEFTSVHSESNRFLELVGLRAERGHYLWVEIVGPEEQGVRYPAHIPQKARWILHVVEHARSDAKIVAILRFAKVCLDLTKQEMRSFKPEQLLDAKAFQKSSRVPFDGDNLLRPTLVHHVSVSRLERSKFKDPLAGKATDSLGEPINTRISKKHRRPWP